MTFKDLCKNFQQAGLINDQALLGISLTETLVYFEVKYILCLSGIFPLMRSFINLADFLIALFFLFDHLLNSYGFCFY